MANIISLKTQQHMQLIDITQEIQQAVADRKPGNTICHIFNPHTTAGLTINEGADPAVARDIITGCKQFVPMDYPFTHLEGNSPAHIMASLMGSSVQVFVEDNRLVLGTWQKIFFCEFDGPRNRKVLWQLYS